MPLLYFTMKTCGPCKIFKPILQQASAQLGVPVNYVDVDTDGAIAQKYGITSVPTLAIVDPITQQIIKRRSGTLNKQELIQFLSEVR